MEDYLDFVLVPIGLLLMLGYHFWLFYHIRYNPTHTVIGLNAINRRFWVSSIMEDAQKNGILAVQTLRNSIMASTLVASTAVMLSSLIAVLMTGGVNHQTTMAFNQQTKTIKFFTIFVSFLVSFFMNVQSIRYLSHASMLINVPHKKIADFTSYRLYVASTVNLGSYFWSLGLHAFYFSFPLFLWLFGAIPMFICSVFLVFFMYFLDITFDHGWAADATSKDEETG